MLLAAGLVLVVAIAAVAYFAIVRGSGGPSRHRTTAGTHSAPITPTSAAPSTPSPTPLPGPWKYIATRGLDPVPLTLAGLFPGTFSVPGGTFTKAVSKKGTVCTAAIVGRRLQRAIRRAGCSQVLRASYLSTGKKLMGTIGVLNLANYAQAELAGKATGRTQFVAQLAGRKGPAKRLTSGTGIEEAVAKGHFLILVWGEFTSGHGPRNGRRRRALEAFLLSMINKTANVNLSNRMVGVPAPSASPSASPASSSPSARSS